MAYHSLKPLKLTEHPHSSRPVQDDLFERRIMIPRQVQAPDRLFLIRLGISEITIGNP